MAAMASGHTAAAKVLLERTACQRSGADSAPFDSPLPAALPAAHCTMTCTVTRATPYIAPGSTPEH